MKLVVDVPEGNYKALKKMSGCCGLGVYHEMILNGTPLSEELEKVKNKLHEKSWTMIGIAQDRQLLDLYEVDKIINDRIAELKGGIE